MRKSIIKGNILKECFPGKKSLTDHEYVNMYLGSGNFGGLFDAYGFMHRPFRQISAVKEYYEKICNTAILHQGHFARGRYGMDYHIPLMQFGFANNLPEEAVKYKQLLNIYDGFMETIFENKQFEYSTTTRFNPYLRNILAIHYEFENMCQDFQLDFQQNLSFNFLESVEASYENVFEGGYEVLSEENELIKLRVFAGSASSIVFIRTQGFVSSKILIKKNQICLSFDKQKDRGNIIIGIADEKNLDEVFSSLMSINDSDKYANECQLAWNKRWGNSYVDIPVDEIQTLWCRSLYYQFCTYSPEPTCPAPPVGWVGNLWNVHFAQDFSYIHPALLRLGHLDIAKAKVEFYASRLDVVKRNTKRIYGVEGAMCPWEHPIGEDFDLFTDGSFPNWFQFELHNAAYPAKMAYETALHTQDIDWTHRIALPLVFESALFYKNISTKAQNGKWDLFVEPSMGQDEHGKPNSKNYLCALFSATYTLKTIIKLAKLLELNEIRLPEDKKLILNECVEIIQDGYNFDSLYNKEHEIYFSCEETNKEGVLGFLKHPVSLNPLFALPLEDKSQPLINAYKIHSKLCNKAWEDENDPKREERICGWTLAAFWVSAAHMGESKDLIFELSKMPGDFMDKNQYEFYESSVLHWMMYYTTIHGLFLQAVNDTIVSDFWGNDQIGYGFPESWKGTKYFNLKTKLGKSYSGLL